MLNTFFDKFIFTGGLKYRHSNFYLLRIPFLITPTAVLIALVSKKDEKLHREIYYSVKDATQKILTKQFDLDFGIEDRDEAIRVFGEFFTASGWGGLRNIDIDLKAKKAIIVVSNSPFASALHGKVKWEVDHFLRGILAGFFSRIFGTNVECIEHKCFAMDRKECEFIIKKQREFDIEKKQVRKQIELEV